MNGVYRSVFKDVTKKSLVEIWNIIVLWTASKLVLVVDSNSFNKLVTKIKIKKSMIVVLKIKLD